LKKKKSKIRVPSDFYGYFGYGQKVANFVKVVTSCYVSRHHKEGTMVIYQKQCKRKVGSFNLRQLFLGLKKKKRLNRFLCVRRRFKKKAYSILTRKKIQIRNVFLRVKTRKRRRVKKLISGLHKRVCFRVIQILLKLYKRRDVLNYTSFVLKTKRSISSRQCLLKKYVAIFYRDSKLIKKYLKVLARYVGLSEFRVRSYILRLRKRYLGVKNKKRKGSLGVLRDHLLNKKILKKLLIKKQINENKRSFLHFFATLKHCKALVLFMSGIPHMHPCVSYKLRLLFLDCWVDFLYYFRFIGTLPVMQQLCSLIWLRKILVWYLHMVEYSSITWDRICNRTLEVESENPFVPSSSIFYSKVLPTNFMASSRVFMKKRLSRFCARKLFQYKKKRLPKLVRKVIKREGIRFVKKMFLSKTFVRKPTVTIFMCKKIKFLFLKLIKIRVVKFTKKLLSMFTKSGCGELFVKKLASNLVNKLVLRFGNKLLNTKFRSFVNRIAIKVAKKLTIKFVKRRVQRFAKKLELRLAQKILLCKSKETIRTFARKVLRRLWNKQVRKLFKKNIRRLVKKRAKGFIWKRQRYWKKIIRRYIVLSKSYNFLSKRLFFLKKYFAVLKEQVDYQKKLYDIFLNICTRSKKFKKKWSRRKRIFFKRKFFLFRLKFSVYDFEESSLVFLKGFFTHRLLSLSPKGLRKQIRMNSFIYSKGLLFNFVSIARQNSLKFFIEQNVCLLKYLYWKNWYKRVYFFVFVFRLQKKGLLWFFKKKLSSLAFLRLFFSKTLVSLRKRLKFVFFYSTVRFFEKNRKRVYKRIRRAIWYMKLRALYGSRLKRWYRWIKRKLKRKRKRERARKHQRKMLEIKKQCLS